MNNDSVLEVGLPANPDRVDVTPQDRLVKDAGLGADFHVADHLGARRDEGARVDVGRHGEVREFLHPVMMQNERDLFKMNAVYKRG